MKGVLSPLLEYLCRVHTKICLLMTEFDAKWGLVSPNVA